MKYHRIFLANNYTFIFYAYFLCATVNYLQLLNMRLNLFKPSVPNRKEIKTCYKFNAKILLMKSVRGQLLALLQIIKILKNILLWAIFFKIAIY